MRCPRCGGSGIPIFYGMPAGPPDEVISCADQFWQLHVYETEEGRLVSGGCCVEPANRACISCGHQWQAFVRQLKTVEGVDIGAGTSPGREPPPRTAS